MDEGGKDTYGMEVLAVYQGATDTLEIIERDDHLISTSDWAQRYNRTLLTR